MSGDGTGAGRRRTRDRDGGTRRVRAKSGRAGSQRRSPVLRGGVAAVAGTAEVLSDVVHQAVEGRRCCSMCAKPGHNARTCPDLSSGWAASRRVPERPSFDSCNRCHGAGVITCRSCRCTSDWDAQMRRKVVNHESSADTIQLLGLSRINFRIDGLVRSEICHACGGTMLMVCDGCHGLVNIL